MNVEEILSTISGGEIDQAIATRDVEEAAQKAQVHSGHLQTIHEAFKNSQFCTKAILFNVLGAQAPCCLAALMFLAGLEYACKHQERGQVDETLQRLEEL